MRVAIVAGPHLPVPPHRYGGTERIIYDLIRGLLEAAVHGHGLHLLPGLADTVRHDPELLCADGVHPNDAGHAALASAVTRPLRAAFG